MSREGYEKLSSELNTLIKERLPEAIDAISEARDKGDLSENFEYRAARREQSRLLGRIRFLQRVLSHARVMPDSEQPLDRVRLLTKVGLTNLSTNMKMTYTIVSPHEANAKELKISVKSPIAQALMNHKVGEVVNVSVPVGIIRLRIETIERG